MSSSNNDSIVSTANDSSLLSSSSQLNSETLLTPPKQSVQNFNAGGIGNNGGSGNNFSTSILQQQHPSSSSLLFLNDDITTPLKLSNVGFQQQKQQQPPSTAPPFLQENSILRTETPELDIDLALGDLNLDDYNDFLSQSRRFTTQHENRSLLNFGSMTPNPQQGVFNPSTPNWSSVVNVPQTAPPFNHSNLDNNSKSMLLNIKSFKLPDDEADGDTTTSSETAQQQSHKFGGSLLSTSTPSLNGLSSNNERRSIDSLDQQSPLPRMMAAPQYQQFPILYGSMDGLNGEFPPSHPHPFGSFPPPPQSASQQPLLPNVLPPMWGGNSNFGHNSFMMPGNNFTQHQQQIPSGHDNDNSSHHQHPQQQQQQQQHIQRRHGQQQQQQQQQRWNNNGVNIHRSKMNNNRRKGEDPSKYANANLEDFKGDIYSLCKDQHGCRFLQKQLDFNEESKTTLIFNETYPHIIELMVDPFGNYLIQKLLEKCNDEQRIIMVKNASTDFFKISINPHGTRALQKLIECVNTEEESLMIIESLKPHVVILSKDLNGNHVVQKCLSKLSQKHNQFIFDISCKNCVEIATHRHGCCVLQRCLDFGSLDQCKQLGLVLSENVLSLSFDPFGNYVIQYILNNSDLIESKDLSITKIFTKINSNFIELSLHKFGSNVIEKILRLPKINEDLIQLILNDLSIKDFNNLLNDPYGNYVLQTCLDVSNYEKFEKLKRNLIPILPSVKNTPHGRRISARLGINLSTLNNNNSSNMGKDDLAVPVNRTITEVDI